MYRRYSTFFKYTFFYLVMLIVALLGITYIINVALVKSIEDSYGEQLDTNSIALENSISNTFLSLTSMNSQLIADINLCLRQYKLDYANTLVTSKLSDSLLINDSLKDIICISADTDTIYSRTCSVKIDHDILYVSDGNLDHLSIPLEAINAEKNNIIKIVSEQNNECLFYIPHFEEYEIISLYWLNDEYFDNLLESTYLPNTINIQILNSEEVVLYNHKQMELSNISLDEYMLSCSYPDINLLFLTDPTITKKLISSTLTIPYAILFTILCTGLICLVLFLENTYVPLRKFAKTVYGHAHKTYDGVDITNLQEISTLFSDIQSENSQLLVKVHNYRANMQKSILSTITTEKNADLFSEEDIDFLFQYNTNQSYYVLYFIFEKTFDFVSFQSMLQEQFFQVKSTMIILENDDTMVTMLVNSPISMVRDSQDLMNAIHSVCFQFSCEVYFSSKSDTPMNFSRLYEEAMQASLHNYHKKQDNVDTLQSQKYPYQRLDLISSHLKQGEFNICKHHIQEIFKQLNNAKYPDFFIRSILLDIITLIFDQFCLSNIAFTKYETLYYETLFMCRNTDYAESSKIFTSITKFLGKYQELHTTPQLTMDSIYQYIEASYKDSNFSLTEISNYYQVSTSYFSSYFSKETNHKFIDYVWELRFAASIKLMADETSSTKDIAEQVGYQNYSSFARKFKDYTGQSPNEYRATIK